MQRFLSLIAVMVSLVILTNCTKEDLLNGLVDNIDLTDNQQAEVVAARLSAEKGGLMAELQTMGAACDSQFYSFFKLDTTFSYQWVNYHINLSFFLENGTEIPIYVPGVTDSISGTAHLSGDTTYTSQSDSNDTWEIHLNRHTNMEVAQILSDTIRVNGNGTDSTSQVLHHEGRTITIQADSHFDAENIRIPLSDPNYIPISGTISGVVAGTITTDDVTKNINIPYLVVFDGNATVTVTLTDSGKTFTLNLLTGEIQWP